MNQIILASHGGLAAGAKDTLEMVLGDVSNVHVVSLARDDKEPITNKVEAMIATFNADDTVYVLTDMLGSSVNNNMAHTSFLSASSIPFLPQRASMAGPAARPSRQLL